ncbi:MAG: peptidylprolyl isomerase [Chloroflexi bacterium]|nr:peptidylprolyl isomerase [Chloroflexota bacterium]
MTIDPSKTYIATLKTAKGQIVVELNGGKAPETVNNFVNLARKGYYNNSTFHRVLPGFMAQGGDPTGTGGGGPGYTIPDEFTDLRHEKGVISMANKGQLHTGGSQFFITYVPTPHLDGLNPDGSRKACGTPGVSCHTVFGKVISGMQVAESLTPRDPNQNPGYLGDRLLEVTIEERAAAAAP